MASSNTMVGGLGFSKRRGANDSGSNGGPSFFAGGNYGVSSRIVSY